MAANRFVLAGIVLGFGMAAAPLPAADLPKPASSIEVPDVALPPELDRVLRDYELLRKAPAEVIVAPVATGSAIIRLIS